MRFFPWARALGALVVLGLTGCSPAIPLAIALPECVPADAQVALLVEEGACSERAAAIAWSGPIDAPLSPFEPGAYCIDALAYSTGMERHGRRCHLEALGRENRRLPRDREPLELSPACAIAPSVLGDDLLREVAGCSGPCDVDRCICSLGCTDDPGASCPSPIEVERVVMGDHYACGLGTDQRSFTCWGDGEPVVEVLGWTVGEGVAEVGLGPSPLRYVAWDGDSDTFCHRDSEGVAICGPDALETSGTNEPRLHAVGRGFACWGEGTLYCVTPTRAVRLEAFAFPIAISAGHDHVCGIVGGAIVCATPFVEEGACGADCPWFEGAAILPPPTVGTPYWVELDLGWDRACAIDSRARLSCWSVDPSDPIGLGPPALSSQRIDGFTGPIRAPRLVDLGPMRRTQQVSVGAEHLCLRDMEGAVRCGRLEDEGGDVRFVDQEPFPSGGNILSFVAGPAGISCAVRGVEGAPNRVECFQLAGFSGREGLLGRAHTRAGLDEQAVCP